MIGLAPASRIEESALDQVNSDVLQMFALVHQAIGSATQIFLDADREAARGLVRRDQQIDSLYDKTEKVVLSQLTGTGGLKAARQKQFLLILRILPELERSGDLAEHIASHAVQGLATSLSPRGRSLVQQMGSLDSEMWELAAEAYARGDGSVAGLLRVRDDEIDDLHVSLTSELAAARVSVPVAIEMALVARYFERLGDHAVNITRRLRHSVEA
jgi:phosphate transport system protein